MKRSRQLVEIDMAELRRVLDRARQEPIGEADYLKLKVALDVLDERLRPTRTTEKTRNVVEQPELAVQILLAAREGGIWPSRLTPGNKLGFHVAEPFARRLVLMCARR
jgi:hypothetical protein